MIPKLDRNTTPDKRGKYAVLKLRRQTKGFSPDLQVAAQKLRDAGLLDFGDDPEKEFFVIRLRDIYAEPALAAYAQAAKADGETEYAKDISALAQRAREHPHKHKPD